MDNSKDIYSAKAVKPLGVFYVPPKFEGRHNRFCKQRGFGKIPAANSERHEITPLKSPMIRRKGRSGKRYY